VGAIKERIKIREGTNSSISHPQPLCGIYGICHVGLDGELNQTCQSSSESVQWFRSSREPKMTPSIDLAHRPYNSVRTNVLTLSCLMYKTADCIRSNGDLQ